MTRRRPTSDAGDRFRGSGHERTFVGQPFPSLNTMDNPAANADGSTEIYFGPISPGESKNWLKTAPRKSRSGQSRLVGGGCGAPSG